MATRRPMLPVAIAGPVPPLEDFAARLVAVCARLGLLDELISAPGESEGLLSQANVEGALTDTMLHGARSGKEVPSMR